MDFWIDNILAVGLTGMLIVKIMMLFFSFIKSRGFGNFSNNRIFKNLLCFQFFNNLFCNLLLRIRMVKNSTTILCPYIVLLAV